MTLERQIYRTRNDPILEPTHSFFPAPLVSLLDGREREVATTSTSARPSTKSTRSKPSQGKDDIPSHLNVLREKRVGKQWVRPQYPPVSRTSPWTLFALGMNSKLFRVRVQCNDSQAIGKTNHYRLRTPFYDKKKLRQ